MALVRPFLTLGVAGSSWVAGRYNASWVERLAQELPLQPEAVGPLRILNVGAGGATSSIVLATQIPRLCALRPNHVFIDPGHVNSAADDGGGPAVSRAQTVTDIQNMVAQLRAAIPGVDITLCTMHSISTTSLTIHPAYPDYVADVLATAALLDVDVLDAYAAATKPLPDLLSYGAVPSRYAAPAGFADWDPQSTFDPAQKDANITLSNGNRTAQSAVLHKGVRGTVSHSAGKFYFEGVRSTATGDCFGIQTAAGNLANFVGSDAAGYGWYYTGDLYHGGVATPTTPALVGGDVMGIAVDFGALKLWLIKNGVAQNGDPVSGAGGAAIAAGTYFPAYSGAGGLFSAQFPYTPGDGLHPIASGAVDVWLYPTVLAWARAKMAAFWGL